MEKYYTDSKIRSFGCDFLSLGLAITDCVFQISSRRMGLKVECGKFSISELNTVQEFLSLLVFGLIAIFVFRSETLAASHLFEFSLLISAIFTVFKKGYFIQII